MHTCCISTLVLFPLLYALCAQAAVLPTASSSLEKVQGLSITNVSRASPASSVAPISLSYRNIVLVFLEFGRPIPEDEVRNTLIEADQAIFGVAQDHPNQRITNDRFEYRRPGGNMLIAITPYVGEEITWMELNRILQGLYKYMTAGPGTETTHYQSLEFEIEAGGQQKAEIGYGLVWYLDLADSDVQKRAWPPSTMSLVNEETLRPQNSTLLQPTNSTLALQTANNVQESQVYPIPRTILKLDFYYFGPPIPDGSVKATLEGAMAKVRPYLNGPTETMRIQNDAFRWILPISLEAGVQVAVTVLTYRDQIITWRQLFDVLFGLYGFTTTFGTDLRETHYQILGFRIVDIFSRKLGVGTISYFRSESSQLAKRMDTVDVETLPQRRSVPKIQSLSLVAGSNSIVYPVAHTDVNLTITFLGDTTIPPSEVNGALSEAMQSIVSEVSQTPDSSIGGIFRAASTTGHVWTSIMAYDPKIIRWKELDDILNGILQFYQDDEDHERQLVFEIDIKGAQRGRVGFGTILYAKQSPTNVETRGLSSNHAGGTIVQQSVNASIRSNLTVSAPIPYPVPHTPIALLFHVFGYPIPPIYANAALTSALRTIQIHVNLHPNMPIPNGRWERRGAIDQVWITVAAEDGNTVSWQDLRDVLAGVLRFMTQTGQDRCRDLGFLIDKEGEINIGYGSLIYVPEGEASIKMEH
ncbi:hypothetical protein BDR22DRAFT_826618 [Usnea florida]